MLEVEALARCYRYDRKKKENNLNSCFPSVCIVVYSGKNHEPVECRYGSKKIMLSLIGYQFDRVVTEERRRLLGIVQGYYYYY